MSMIPDEVRYEVFKRRVDGTLFDIPATNTPFRRLEDARRLAEQWTAEAYSLYLMERNGPTPHPGPATFVVVRQTVKREVL